MAVAERKVCKVCGKSKPVREFWKRKDKTVVDTCKECLSRDIDVQKPSTFLPILKDIDIPFDESCWINMCKAKYAKDPERFNAQSVIGTYIRSCLNLTKYQNMTYADTVKLNEEKIKTRQKKKELAAKAKEQEQPEELPQDKEEEPLDITIKPGDKAATTDYSYGAYSEMMMDRAERREIRENLKKRRENLQRRQEERLQRQEEKEQREEERLRKKEETQNLIELTSVDEQSILDELTQKEIQQLAMKWGENFRPSEWLKMEEMYARYCDEFDIGVDREAVLISLCKTSVNMQRCLDAGDASNAAKFSSMFDQLRKSGAFTEAQKKEEKERYLDSVGELVAAVEREGGVIPQFDYQFEVNQDKVDLTLKDMQSYTYNLVKNEMGLGDLIESYIQRLDQQREEERNKSLDDGLVISSAEEQEIENDKYADDFFKSLEDSIANEADSIYSRIGEDDINGA